MESGFLTDEFAVAVTGSESLGKMPVGSKLQETECLF